MSRIYQKLDRKKSRDVRVLRDFIAIFCREKHQDNKEPFRARDARLQQVLGDEPLPLCGECSRLFRHGVAKLLLCPYNPKPMCKKCTTHCYAPGYRERIREVMRFSGIYLVKHGRLDLLLHYFF